MTDKGKLLSIIKKLQKKRRIRKVLEPVLEVENMDAVLFVESEIEHKSYTRDQTAGVRNALRNMTDGE